MSVSIFDPRQSLRARIALAVASLTLVLAIVLTVITGQISGRRLERSIGQTLAQLSVTTIGQLNRTMFEHWREIRLTASQETLFSSPNNAPEVRAVFNQLKATYREYAWIGWASTSGIVIASTDDLLEGQSVADRPWFQKAQTLTTPYVGDIHQALLLTQVLPPVAEGMPQRFVDVAMPIWTSDGKSLGVLGAYLDWSFMRDQSESVQRTFTRQNVGPGSEPDSIDVFVLAADGTVLVGPPIWNMPMTDKLPQLPLQALQVAGTDPAGYFTVTWPDTGTTYLTGYARDTGFRGYPGLGWIVVVRERADVALASVTQLQAVLLGLGVIFAILFSAIGWLLALQITRPLARVASLAREIKTGDEGIGRPPAIVTGDEVTVLSHTIDRLLVALNGRNIKLTDLNATLEQRIQARTEELAVSHRFNEKIVSTVPDVIYIFDLATGKYIFVNQAITILTNRTADEFRASANRLDAQEGIHPDDLQTYRHTLERLHQAPDGAQVEQAFRVRQSDDQWRWFYTRETVFTRDADGNVSQVLGIAQDITLRKQAEDKLQEMAAAQERQRLARELHDSVTQALFSASMVAQTLPLLWDQGETIVKKNLEELSRLTRGALAEMRTLLNELRPTAIATADLGELLTHLLDAARGRTQAECVLELKGEGSVPPEVKVAAYRVAQEALNNVTKHARAARVEVELNQEPGIMEISILDNGRGFNLDAQHSSTSDHFGLGIMRERAKEVGADVKVYSQPGQGTQVIFTWHIPEAALVPSTEVIS